VTSVAANVVEVVKKEAATQGLTLDDAKSAAVAIYRQKRAGFSTWREKVSPIGQIWESSRPGQNGGSLTDAHPNQRLSVRSTDITTYRIRMANTETNSKQADTFFNVCHLGR
jgi:hypothetical protein